MEQNKINLRFSVITLMIVLAGLSRLLPHPPNFAPIGGMALFGAAYFSRRYWAFIIPIATMWISDLILNNVVYGQYFDHFVWFYSGSIFTYGAFAIIVLMGLKTLKNVKPANLFVSVIASSIIFFIVSNFGVWLSSGMYPHSFEGLMVCYSAAIPFFHNTLLGDILYSGVLFGAFELSTKFIPALRTTESV